MSSTREDTQTAKDHSKNDQTESNESANQEKQPEQAEAEPIKFSSSAGLLARLKSLNASFAFTSYESNLLYLVGHNNQGGLHIHQSAVARPMGLFLDESGGLTLSGAYQILRFQNVLEAEQRINHHHDACYVPRVIHNTGQLDAHDVGIDKKGRAVFINTSYNCLATVSDKHSFEVLWQPPFISALVNEDRCHLNGLAMEGDQPRYATAVSASDTIDGWRDRRSGGGIVIDIENDQIICRGLSMPHSPRIHNGELWLLNSGTGELGVVKRKDDNTEGEFEARAFCPGFVRGLAFCGDFAFVGLSKPRYERFEGLPLDQKLKDVDSDPWCGVQVIQLSTGTCVDWLRIDGKLSELYDLEILPGMLAPMAVAPESAEVTQLITFANPDSEQLETE